MYKSIVLILCCTVKIVSVFIINITFADWIIFVWTFMAAVLPDILIELEEPLMQKRREKLLKRYQDEEAVWQPPAIKQASE